MLREAVIPRHVQKAFRIAQDLPPGQGVRTWPVYFTTTYAGEPVHLGWQSVVVRKDEPIAYEKLAKNDGMVQRTTGVIATKLRNGEARARGIAQEVKTEFEIRALRIPGLYLGAFWLYATNGRRELDRILPYAAFDGELQEGEQYTFRAFVEAVRRARAKLPPMPRD